MSSVYSRKVRVRHQPQAYFLQAVDLLPKISLDSDYTIQAYNKFFKPHSSAICLIYHDTYKLIVFWCRGQLWIAVGRITYVRC